MKKIGDITNTADKNGEFTDGNVAAGTPPTQLMGAWFNSVQREILNVLAKAGIPQSATKEDQLAEAITKIVAGAGYLPTGYSYSKIESDDRYQPKGNYAPSGDYATNTILNNGLDKKLDKDNPSANGSLSVRGKGDYAILSLYKQSGERVDIETLSDEVSNSLNIINRSKTGENISVVSIPKRNGSVVLAGDFGLGAKKTSDLIKVTDYTSGINKTFGFIYNDSGATGAPASWGGGIVFGRDPATSSSILYSPDWNTRLFLSAATSDGKMSDWVEFYSTGNTVRDRNGNLRVSGYDDLSDYPVGSPIPWPQSTAPSGFLVCNGQSFNKSTYPLLAKAYPSGALPDMRSEFIRGLDAGRNIDVSRAVLSQQSDAIQNIKGEITVSAERTNSSAGTGAFNYTQISGTAVTSEYYTRQLQKFDFDASRVARTANETRPRNIAFLYIVRAA